MKIPNCHICSGCCPHSVTHFFSPRTKFPPDSASLHNYEFDGGDDGEGYECSGNGDGNHEFNYEFDGGDHKFDYKFDGGDHEFDCEFGGDHEFTSTYRGHHYVGCGGHSAHYQLLDHNLWPE